MALSSELMPVVSARALARDYVEVCSGVEVPLLGPGAGGGVVRVGSTVRRDVGRTPDAMINVLWHLENVGFDGAPRVLGIDRCDRWVFTYVEGEVGLPPYAPWICEDSLLASVAMLLRRYHVAVSSFSPDYDVLWPTNPPAGYEGDIVGHMDVSMANVVCHNQAATCLIDFEEVGKVDRLWDFVRAARHWVPLLDPSDLTGALSLSVGRQSYRLGLFADSFGLRLSERERVIDAVLLSANVSYARMKERADAGQLGYFREWYGEAAMRNRRGRLWVERERRSLERSLGL